MTRRGGLAREVPGYRRDLPDVNSRVKCSGVESVEAEDEEEVLVSIILTLLNSSTRTRRNGLNVSVGFG